MGYPPPSSSCTRSWRRPPQEGEQWRAVAAGAEQQAGWQAALVAGRSTATGLQGSALAAELLAYMRGWVRGGG